MAVGLAVGAAAGPGLARYDPIRRTGNRRWEVHYTRTHIE